MHGAFDLGLSSTIVGCQSLPGNLWQHARLQFLGVPESVTYLCDTWAALETPLRFNVPHQDQVHIKCGKKNGGDVTAIDCISLEPVDILVVGPPCPPWSSLSLEPIDCISYKRKLMHIILNLKSVKIGKDREKVRHQR